MLRRCIILALVLFGVSGAVGQIAPVTGLRDNTPTVHAFTNARIVVAPGKIIPEGTLVVRNGVIESAGEKVTPPADARIWDMKGLTLYPGLIELSSDIGMPKPAATAQTSPFDFAAPPPQPEKPKGPAHWNARVRADFSADAEFTPDAKAAEKLRSQGFTLALVTPQRGIFRGSSALVNLGDGPASDLVVRRQMAQHISFESGGGFFSGYPNSLMGVIALIRQTWYDADWYRKALDAYTKRPGNQKRPETNAALSALADAIQTRKPVVIDVSDDMNFLRAARISKEFSLNAWIRGSGQEYRRIEAVKGTKLPVILPLHFPEAPSVDVPEEAMAVTLEELRHYDAAPENAGRLEKAGVPIALTSAQLKDQATFLAQVRTAIERGLSADAALSALTTTPAKWLGVDKQYGSLEAGKAANLIVTDGDLFAGKTKIRGVWIDGKEYEVKTAPVSDPRGIWDLIATTKETRSGKLTLKGDAEKPTGSIDWQGKELRLSSATYSAGRLSMTLSGDSAGTPGMIRMSGSVSRNEIFGIGELPDGGRFSWKATRKESAKEEADTSKPKKPEMASFTDVFPPGEYGRATPPDQPANVLIKNATIWTQGPEGKLQNADMLVTKGKIARIATGIEAPKDAVIIDATGKHLSPGLIDCHSHTAAASINEGGQAITCETRIEDVLDPDDMWIYRQLAGGTTAANILHGSANPIGGQNAVVKWRWGALPDEMVIAGAPPGVKFALGENVKQSNFTPGGRPSGRYPQTRMGVDQIIRDRFQAALDYEREWKEWEKDKTRIPPRKDLELDALVEMVKGKRLVHCHSYRQDEILMMMRIAEDFGFRIATFQHVLEGYKVADVMARHGAGGSSFSDWWAYKIEAWDAIPGNGPLMHSQGVLVSYNSDNSQLASRLNWEASKAVKFGLSEEEAFKFVTINPAKQLRIDDKVGSLEVNKDADFVLWSGNPLSAYSKCEQTWVDGRKYFDIQEDQQTRKQIEKERATLIQKILASKKERPAPAAAAPVRFRRPNEIRLNTCMEGLDHESN